MFGTKARLRVTETLSGTTGKPLGRLTTAKRVEPITKFLGPKTEDPHHGSRARTKRNMKTSVITEKVVTIF